MYNLLFRKYCILKIVNGLSGCCRQYNNGQGRGLSHGNCPRSPEGRHQRDLWPQQRWRFALPFTIQKQQTLQRLRSPQGAQQPPASPVFVVFIQQQVLLPLSLPPPLPQTVFPLSLWQPSQTWPPIRATPPYGKLWLPLPLQALSSPTQQVPLQQVRPGS